MRLDHLARLTPEQAKRRRKLTLELLWVCAFALVPWTIYLAVSLPDVYGTRHWSLAWAGFDVLELLALGATAYFGWRGRQALIGTAIAAATLLICDAWFDVTLNLGTPDIWMAVGSAALIELPLALFLIHRATMLMRLTMLRLLSQTDVRGRPIRLSKLPLIALLPFDDDHDPDQDPEFGDEAAHAHDSQYAGDRERDPGAP